VESEIKDLYVPNYELLRGQGPTELPQGPRGQIKELQLPVELISEQTFKILLLI
jgi:hypothetical protein